MEVVLIPRSRSSSVSSSTGSTTTNNKVDNSQGSKLILTVRNLQRKKNAGNRRSIRGVLCLGFVSSVIGLATVILEAISTHKYPNASAALLNIESAGIFVGCFAAVNGILGYFMWRISASGHKSCLVKFHKFLSNFVAICSFCTFGLSLTALGIYGTLLDWQRGIAPNLYYDPGMSISRFSPQDLGYPMYALEELAALKATAVSFHLIIFLTSLTTSVLCLFNIYVGGLPDFASCEEALKTFSYFR